MKYLLVFYFAGFFLATATQIKKYKLSVEPKENKFQGTVTLTLSDIKGKFVQLDKYAYSVTSCDYIKTKQLSGLLDDLKPCNFTEASDKIEFEEDITGDVEVILEFEGECKENGLSMYKTESNERFYVADMTAKDHEIIFPCTKDEKAEFEFGGDGAVVMSNLENLRKKDEGKKISLGELAFVQGDITEDKESIKSLPYYHMKSSNKVGKKLKNVMEKVAKFDPSLKILFTPAKGDIRTNARDVIIFSGIDLKPDDSESDYSDMARILGKKVFQKSEGKEKTFLDIVGPTFAEMQISGDFRLEAMRKLMTIPTLEMDGFKNSMSLNQLVSKNDEENSLVLNIKGASVLYSLDSLCKDGKFAQGLSNYRNGNSKLNEAFKQCFGNEKEAEDFFNAWTDRPGYPVVNVMLNKNKTAEYSISQEQFLWYGSGEKDQTWIIPTDYKTKEGSVGDITLSADKKDVVATINSTYFILDHNNKGFYRINYDAKLWEALISQLKSNHTAIDPFNRMKLMDDVFSFPKSTHNFTHAGPDYVTALKLSEYLKNETDSSALMGAFYALDFLDSALNSSYHGKYRDHMKGILNVLYNNTKEIKEPVARDQVNLLSCKFGVEECIKNASLTFKEIKSNATELTELQQSAICSVVRNNSTKWMESSALMNAMGIRKELQQRLLTCSKDEQILSLFLTQVIAEKDEKVFVNAVTSIMNHNPDNIKVVLDIIKRFEGAIIKAFGKPRLGKIVRLALPRLNTESAVVVQKIAEDLGDEDLKKEVKEVCENVKLWADTKAKSVGTYFDGKRSGSGSHAKPIALLLLAATLLPLANHIFLS